MTVIVIMFIIIIISSSSSVFNSSVSILTCLYYFVYAWQVNGFKGAYKHHGKKRVAGLPTCRYGSRRRRHPRV